MTTKPLTIKSATIIVSDAALDWIYLDTDLPGATWPYDSPINLSFGAAAGSGQDYLKKNFGLEDHQITVIDNSNVLDR